MKRVARSEPGEGASRRLFQTSWRDFPGSWTYVGSGAQARYLSQGHSTDELRSRWRRVEGDGRWPIGGLLFSVTAAFA